MRLPYELSPEQRERLERLQKDLTKIAARPAAVAKKLAKFQGIERKALAAIAELESEADGTDLRVAEKLLGRRQQILLLRNTLAQTEAEYAGLLGPVRHAVVRAHAELAPILRPLLAACLAEMTAAIAPYCEPGLRAELTAKQLPAYSYVMLFCREEVAPPPQDLSLALLLLDEKLSIIANVLAGGEVLADYRSTVALASRLKSRPAAYQQTAEALNAQPAQITRADHQGTPVAL